MFSFDRLKLDGDFFSRNDVDTKVYIAWDAMSIRDEQLDRRRTKRARTNPFTQPVLATHTKV